MNKDSSKHDSDVDESQTVTSTTSPSMEEGTPDAKPPSKKTTNGGQNAENVLPEENQTSTHKPKGLDTNTLECSTAATESNAINNPTDLTTPNGGIQNHSFEDFAAGGIEPLPFLPTSLRRGANHQPNARPGAYIGASEQRTTNLDFSLASCQ
ncbi:expressed unknown protein [Seminavis robusta]|uniref:Uncharacterized protein n=1 Tax=Seminavis robusta TaxID=568900 RepID=A0A9N8EPC6_9STRA|nr:expressed unknown protein [Seminavis robusta]|eukprot:Sro1283_g259080.1 n/a (153) ;mRNA; r:7550-8082